VHWCNREEPQQGAAARLTCVNCSSMMNDHQPIPSLRVDADIERRRPGVKDISSKSRGLARVGKVVLTPFASAILENSSHLMRPTSLEMLPH
jgi:hypothetical protein